MSETEPFRWVFPYAEDPTSGRTHPTGRIVYRPVVNITLSGPAEDATFVVRSGAYAQFTVTFSRQALRLAIEPVEAFDARFHSA